MANYDFKDKLYNAGTVIPITITLAPAGVGLANGAVRASAAYDNTTNLLDDAELRASFKTVAGSLGTSPVVEIWVAGISYGEAWPDGLDGTDNAYTLKSVPGLTRVLTVPIHTAAVACPSQPIDLAWFFGGRLPKQMQFVVKNASGLALDGSAPGGLELVGHYGQAVAQV